MRHPMPVTSSRRSRLLFIAATLAVCDGLFLVWRSDYDAVRVPITHVGLDSLSATLPSSTTAAALVSGRWTPALDQASIAVEDNRRQRRPVVLVTLAPHPTYGHFLQVLRQLKASRKCNVLVLEGGDWTSEPEIGSEASARYIDIPALVLCGHAIGDAGITGTLPPDRTLRL